MVRADVGALRCHGPDPPPPQPADASTPGSSAVRPRRRRRKLAAKEKAEQGKDAEMAPGAGNNPNMETDDPDFYNVGGELVGLVGKAACGTASRGSSSVASRSSAARGAGERSSSRGVGDVESISVGSRVTFHSGKLRGMVGVVQCLGAGSGGQVLLDGRQEKCFFAKKDAKLEVAS